MYLQLVQVYEEATMLYREGIGKAVTVQTVSRAACLNCDVDDVFDYDDAAIAYSTFIKEITVQTAYRKACLNYDVDDVFDYDDAAIASIICIKEITVQTITSLPPLLLHLQPQPRLPDCPFIVPQSGRPLQKPGIEASPNY